MSWQGPEQGQCQASTPSGVVGALVQTAQLSSSTRLTEPQGTWWLLAEAAYRHALHQSEQLDCISQLPYLLEVRISASQKSPVRPKLL